MSLSSSSCKKHSADTMMGVSGYSPGLRDLGDLLTSSLIVNKVLEFADFDSLLSLRLVNRSLGRVVTEKELFYRSVRALPADINVRGQTFINTFCIHKGWSPKQSSVLQTALEKADTFGNESGIMYDREDAMRRLHAGEDVMISHFPRLEHGRDEEVEEDDAYSYWAVSAQLSNGIFGASRVWRTLKTLFDLQSGSDAFSQILFGFLVNSSTVRGNFCQSKWMRGDTPGMERKFHVLIELNNGQKFEIEASKVFADNQR